MSDQREMNRPSAMTITRAGTGITGGPEGVASGPFGLQSLLSGRADGEMTALRAFFDPGVVTHWHSHPQGQLLFVLEGVGLVQRDGGDVLEVRAGDTVWFAAGERHWHGAGPANSFGYISVQQVENASAVTWFEPVNRPGDRR